MPNEIQDLILFRALKARIEEENFSEKISDLPYQRSLALCKSIQKYSMGMCYAFQLSRRENLPHKEIEDLQYLGLTKIAAFCLSSDTCQDLTIFLQQLKIRHEEKILSSDVYKDILKECLKINPLKTLKEAVLMDGGKETIVENILEGRGQESLIQRIIILHSRREIPNNCPTFILLVSLLSDGASPEERGELLRVIKSYKTSV